MQENVLSHPSYLQNLQVLEYYLLKHLSTLLTHKRFVNQEAIEMVFDKYI